MTMIRWILLLSLAWAIASPPLAAADPAAEAIIQKAIKAHGGKDALEKYVAGTSSVKGTMNLFSMEIPYTAELKFQFPGQFKMITNLEIAQQKVKVIQTINQEQYTTLLNDEKKPLGEAEKTELRQGLRIQEMGTLLPLLDEKRYAVTVGKAKKVGDRDVVILNVSSKGMIDTELGFDPKSGLLVTMARKATTETGDQVLEESLLSEFKTFGGIEIATKVVVLRDGKKFMTMFVVDTQVLDKLDPKEFE
jgi:hypothetical protein